MYTFTTVVQLQRITGIIYSKESEVLVNACVGWTADVGKVSAESRSRVNAHEKHVLVMLTYCIKVPLLFTQLHLIQLSKGTFETSRTVRTAEI